MKSKYHDGDDGDFADYTLELLGDLQATGVQFVLSVGSTITVQITHPKTAISTKKAFGADIKMAIVWIRDEACRLYLDSEFENKYGPYYQSPYVPGSPEARAAGCICPPDQDPQRLITMERCVEHGSAHWRLKDGELVEFDDRGRPVVK